MEPKEEEIKREHMEEEDEGEELTEQETGEIGQKRGGLDIASLKREFEKSAPHELVRVKYVVFLAYLGAGFNGFQYQPKGAYPGNPLLTVQGEVERILSALGFKRWYLSSGSRTDKGVSAYRHPIALDVEQPKEVDCFYKENTHL